jgi:drug/metabolite transporter (DMT)-like permease
MDLVSSTLQSIALNFVSGSVYQMMRGGTIVTTFMFSVLLLNMKALKRQWVGSILTVGGILIVGISNYMYLTESSTSTSKNSVHYFLFMFYKLQDLFC